MSCRDLLTVTRDVEWVSEMFLFINTIVMARSSLPQDAGRLH